MIDKDFRVSLIEINTNPALSVPCPLLARILSNLLDSTFRIAIDPLFPPPEFLAKKMNSGDILPETKFELVFDERQCGAEL
jgi:hypothetical protein